MDLEDHVPERVSIPGDEEDEDGDPGGEGCACPCHEGQAPGDSGLHCYHCSLKVRGFAIQYVFAAF